MLIQRFDAKCSYDVRSHLLHCRPALIEAVGDFSAARPFANCAYLSKDAAVAVWAGRRRCPIVIYHSLYLEQNECLLQRTRVPKTHHVNSCCCKVLLPVNQTENIHDLKRIVEKEEAVKFQVSQLRNKCIPQKKLSTVKLRNFILSSFTDV